MIIFGNHISSILYQQLHDLYVAIGGSINKWGCPLTPLPPSVVDVSPMLHKVLCDLEVTIVCCLMQRSPAIVVLWVQRMTLRNGSYN